MAKIRAYTRDSTFVPWQSEAMRAAAAIEGRRRRLEESHQNTAGVQWIVHQWVHVRRHLADKEGFFGRLLTVASTNYGQQFTVYLPVALHGDTRTTIMVDQELIRPLRASDFISGRDEPGRKAPMRNGVKMEPNRDGRSVEANARFLEMCARALNACKGDGDEETPVTTRVEIQTALGGYPAPEVIETLQELGHIDPDTTRQGTIIKDRYYLTKRGVTWRKTLASRFPKLAEPQRSKSAPAKRSPAKSEDSPNAGSGAKRSQGTRAASPPSDTSTSSPSLKVTRATTRRSPTRTVEAGRQTPTSNAGQSRKSTRGSMKRPSTTIEDSGEETAARTQAAGASSATSSSSEDRSSRESD